MKKRKIRGEKELNANSFRFLSNLIFFLNLFIALLIITGAWILSETQFGQSALILGFLMLCISVLLKAVRWW
jgi:hypothetical protein